MTPCLIILFKPPEYGLKAQFDNLLNVRKRLQNGWNYSVTASGEIELKTLTRVARCRVSRVEQSHHFNCNTEMPAVFCCES